MTRSWLVTFVARLTLHVDKFSCPTVCVEHGASKHRDNLYLMSACVIVYACVYVQINYADMLKRVEPLRDELHSLELQAQENKNRGEEVTNLIMQLEHSIASYKEEYAQLISQAQAIKTDLENVQAKVQFVRLLYLQLRTVNLILSCPYSLQPHFYQLQIILCRNLKRQTLCNMYGNPSLIWSLLIWMSDSLGQQI